MATIAADPTYDLPTLNTFVAQQENRLEGPLTKIGNANGQTTLDIDVMAGKPTKNAVVTTGTVPAGRQTISSGQIYISGQLKAATAYR